MARMRLRSRPPRALGEGWVLPRGSGRWTTVGNLDSPHRVAVDPAGLVTLAGAGWSLDWWVGAEDRWHLPCREVAVRQSLVGSSPVVETRLRIPSGDAVHRVYAARDAAGAEALVVEVENQSKVPVALALALRPHDQLHVGRIEHLAVAGSTVLVDGHTVLLAPKAPGRLALSDGAADSAAAVLGGDAAVPGPEVAEVRCPDGLAQGALLFPLAHTAALRVVLPLPPGADVDPAGLPTAAQVASGWARQAGQGTRVEVPDRRLRDAVAGSLRHLLLAEPDPAVGAALDLYGFPDEARRHLLADLAALARTDRPGFALAALARHLELTDDVEVARAAAEVVAPLVAALRGTAPADHAAGVAALPGVAALLERAGEPRAADDARRAAVVLGAASPRLEADGDQPSLSALLANAGSTWSWPGPGTGHDPVANARLVTLVRALLVREAPDGLDLAPDVPEAWLGQGWELHDAPTRHGRLSYAVRWHGDRPALLWELTPPAGSEGATTTLRAPGLDPTWSTTERRGEALLSPVALPEKAPRRGVSLPVTIEPAPRRRT